MKQFKFFHIADIHLNEPGDQAHIALQKAIDKAHKLDVDVVVMAGDIFDTRSTAAMRSELAEMLKKPISGKKKAFVLIRGNHDENQELDVFDKQQMLAQDDVYTFNSACSSPVLCFDVWVHAIPHFNKCFDGTLADGLEGFINDVKDIILNFPDLPHFVVCHGSFAGAQLDNGYIPRHNGLELPLNHLNELGIPVMAGHYHKCQQVSDWIWYSGSPTCHNYGEAGHDKGGLLWTWDEINGWHQTPEFISLNPPIMKTVDLWFEDGALQGVDALPADGENTHLKVRLHVNQDDAEVAMQQLSPIQYNASDFAELKIERVIKPKQTARLDRSQSIASVQDGVKTWLTHTGHDAEVIGHVVDAMDEVIG
jgi:DNA repair exonuclease SbcCD nuclease subunit